MSGMKLFLVHDAWKRTDEDTRREMRGRLMRDIKSLEEPHPFFFSKGAEDEEKRLAYYRALLGVIDWMEDEG